MNRWVLGVLICFGVGCETTPGPEPDPYPDIEKPAFLGQLVTFDSREGVGPALIALYTIETREWVASQTTGGEGSFVFEGLAPGDYVPVVYHDRRRVLQLPQPSFGLGDRSVVEWEIPMGRQAPLVAGTEFDLTGRVTDAVSGEPVEGVLVEVTQALDQSTFSEVEGRSTLFTQPTDADGSFRIDDILGVGIGGGPQLIPHVRFSRLGYQSTTAGGWASGDFPGHVEVTLTPGQDTAGVRGRLIDAATLDPVADLQVGVDWRRGPGQFPKSFLDQIIRSGPSGEFELTTLPAGGHILRAALETDDGWISFDQPGLELVTDSVLDLGDVLVSRALNVLAPASNAVVEGNLTVEWDPVANVETYELRFFHEDRGVELRAFADGDVESYTPPPEDLGFFEPGGTYVLLMIAYCSPTTESTRTERTRVFTIAP